MATNLEYVNYVCKQIEKVGNIRYKKMFGEYMIYVNDKPIITVCDCTPYVKQLDVIKPMMKDADKGYPYKGAKECYILDIDDALFSKKVIEKIEQVTPIPKPRKNKNN